MKIFRKKITKGFTLVETMVAVGVLSLSIAATFTAVQGGLQSSTFAKDQITAFYLAQEGMEFIRNIRDENALYSIDGVSRTWLQGLAESGDPCSTGKTCRIDSKLKGITDCASDPGGVCINIKQDSAGLYGYTTGSVTRFKRTIQFQPITAGEEVVATITVSWTARGSTKSFQVRQSFFNHQ